MGVSDQKLARIIARVLKFSSLACVVGGTGYLAYYYATQNERGRERGVEYAKLPKIKKIQIPEEYQPQYIEKQRRKYQQILKQKQKTSM